MDIETFSMILDDTYLIDIWLPSFRSKEFEKISCSKWAFGEIKEYVSIGLYPYHCGTLQDYCDIVNDFMLKMLRYSSGETNPKVSQIFNIAYKAAVNVLDLLRSMK